MIRRLSTKWVLAVLAAVTVPFVGLAIFVSTELSDRLAGEVVRYHLLSLSADLTDWIDDESAERQLDLEHLVSNPVIAWHLEAQAERSGQDEAAVRRRMPKVSILFWKMLQFMTSSTTPRRAPSTSTLRTNATW